METIHQYPQEDLYGIHPEHFMDSMEHRVGRPLENIAMTLGADAMTLLFTDTTPERSAKREGIRHAAGAKHAENAMQLVSVEYLTEPTEAFDAAGFTAYHQGSAYGTEYTLAA